MTSVSRAAFERHARLLRELEAVPEDVSLWVSRGLAEVRVSVDGAEEVVSEGVSECVDRLRRRAADLAPHADALRNLDSECRLVDPVDRSGPSRRIALTEDGRVTALVALDPSRPGAAPDVTPLGPRELTRPFERSVRENLRHWDREEPFARALARLLGLPLLPGPGEAEPVSAPSAANTCPVCLVAVTDGGVVCLEDTCRVPYHENCLGQWLVAVPGNVRRFQTVRGECPACGSSISCAAPVENQ